MYRIKIICIALSETGFSVSLSETEDGPRLCMNIGLAEAQVLSLQLSGEHVERPLSADLTLKILDDLDARLQKAIIYELKEGVFYANLHIETLGGKLLIVDCRPSDALILSLKHASPIFITESLMNKCGLQPTSPSADSGTIDHHDAPLSRGQILRKKLKRAINEEDYEEAARLRDDINALKTGEHRV